MRWLVESSLRLRFLVLALAAALVPLGVFRLQGVAVDTLPEFSPPYVEIQTEALGLSATEVEALVTVPVEELLSGMPWLESVRSESVTGLSSIVLVFEPGTDLPRARQLVQERITQAQMIPSKKVARAPVMLQPLSSAGRVSMVGLSSAELSLIELSVLARWNIKPRLLGVPGVANVAVWGQRERQLQVQVDPARLGARGVTLEQIVETAGNALWVSPLSFLEASTPGSGGFIDTPNQRLGIRHLLPISTPAELAQVPLEGCATTRLAARLAAAQPPAGPPADAACPAGAGPVRLGDVATVVEAHQPLIGDAVVGDGRGLLLVIEKFPDADLLAVTRGVEAALAALAPGLPGVVVDTDVFRPATFVERALENLTRALLLGFVLAALVLFAFLGSWRSGLVSLVTLPLALGAALLVLAALGAALNVMVLAGLIVALGLMIDDAVLDSENIARRLRERREGEGAAARRSVARTVFGAVLEVRTPALYATLILLLAAMPVFFLGGLFGAFYRPLALAYVLATLASTAVALFVTPALSLALLNRAGRHPARAAPFAHALERPFEGLFRRLVTHAAPAYLLAGTLVVVGAAALAQLRPAAPLPALQELDLVVRWTGEPGSSRPAMTALADRASRDLRAVPGVRNVSAHVGRAVTGDQVVAINAGELWLRLEPGADYDRTVEGVQGVLGGLPDLGGGVLGYSGALTRDALAEADTPLTVRLYGHDFGVLRAKAAEVEGLLGVVEGVKSVTTERPTLEPVLEVEPDLAAGGRYGLKPGDVRRAATTLLNGLEVGNLFEAQKVFDVVVVGTPGVRDSLDDVENLLVDAPDGSQVRLGEVAAVTTVPTPNVIRREGASRRLDVTATLAGRDVGAVVREVEAALAGISFPLEYHAEVLGEFAELRAAQRTLWGYIVAAVVGIFLLLQAAFRSWRLATLAFLALPVALSGGAVAAALGDRELSLGVLVGLLTVFGVAVRNGVVLLSRLQHLEQREGEAFGLALVLRGAKERFTPILMTALALTLVALPLALFGNAAGLGFLVPAATVTVGGLVSATLLNLFVLPALYLRVRAHPEPEVDLGAVPADDGFGFFGGAADAAD